MQVNSLHTISRTRRENTLKCEYSTHRTILCSTKLKTVFTLTKSNSICNLDYQLFFFENTDFFFQM